MGPEDDKSHDAGLDASERSLDQPDAIHQAFRRQFWAIVAASVVLVAAFAIVIKL